MKSIVTNSLRNQFIILLVFISVTVILTGFYQYRKVKEVTRKENHDELRAISMLKVSQLVQWHKERLSEVAFFSGSLPFSQYVRGIKQGKSSDEIVMRNSLLRIMSNNRYENIFLISDKGDLLFSVSKDFILTDELTLNNSKTVFQTKELTINDFFYCKAHNAIHYEIMVPVLDKGKAIAVLVFRINPDDYIFPLVKEWSANGKTAETLIVRKEGDSVVFLNRLRFYNNSSMSFRLPVGSTGIPAVKAVHGYEGIFEGTDYRGKKVLSDIRKIPGSDWFMITKIDEEEIYSDLNKRIVLIAVIIFVTILLLAIMMAWIFQYRQRNIYKELYTRKSELHESQEEFRATLYSIGDGVITTNREGIVKQMNPVAEKLTGWKERNAKGKKLDEIFQVIDEETLEKVKNPVTKVIKEGFAVNLARHTLLVSKNGVEIPVSNSGAPIKDEKGTITGVVLVFSDRTEERAQQKELSESEERFRLVMENSADAILITVSDGTILSANTAACEMFGMTAEEIVTSGRHGLVDISDPRLADLLESRELEGKSKGELNFIRKNGTKFPAELTSSVFYNSKGELRTSMIIRDISERKKAEELIRNERNLLRTLIDNMPDAIYIKDREGRKLLANAADIKIMNIAAEADVIGKTDLEIFGNESGKAGYVEDMSVILTQQAIVNKENYYFDNEGKQRWRLISKFPILDEKGRITGVLGIGRDFTARKQVEVQLRESINNYRELIDGMNETVWVIGFDGNLIDVNKAAVNVSGYTKDELLSIGLYGIDSGLEKKDIDRLVKNMEKDKIQIFETSHKTKDGRVFPVEIYSSLVTYQGKKSILSIARDITERKKAGEALKESEQRFRRIAENARDIIYRYDYYPEGHFSYVSPAALKMTGYTSEEFYKEPEMNLKLLHPADRPLLNEITETLYYPVTLRWITKEGKLVWTEQINVPVFDSKGNLIAIEGIVRDVTERKLFEVKLIEKNEEYLKLNQEYLIINEELTESIERIQKMNVELIKAKEKAEESDRLKTAFLANVSHEIRTPMNGILGFMELIKNPDMEEDQRERFIDLVNMSGQRLLNTIDDIMEISKIESGQLDVHISDEVLAEVMDYHYNFFKQQTDEKNIRLKLKEQISSDCIVRTDRIKLEGILTNLLSNAMKFTHKGSIEFGNYIDGNTIVFYVKDTGIGIPADRQEYIFERFIQADMGITRPYEGSGLGLSIVKAYVEMLRGKIWINSEVGKGSEFFFSIPYHPVEIKTKVKKSHADHKAKLPAGLILLIAEDDEVCYNYMEYLLETEGITLLHTKNGEDTVKMVKENPDISLVFLDIKMPGMNGLEAVHRIRQFNETIPVIAQTAFTFSVDKDKAIEAGCNDYISKPIHPETIINIIQKYTTKEN